MRNTEQTIDWYRENEVWPDQIGFDPDGMCMKICRTARGLEAMFPSAISSQLAVPEKYQITKAEDIRVGMNGYYDDPNDDNPFGHIITFVGRVKGEDPKSLNSLLARTNSVLPNQIIVVRGNFFGERWGDHFQFATPWINGEIMPGLGGQNKKPLGKNSSLKKAEKILQETIKRHKKKGHKRLVAALERDLENLQKTIKKFSQKEKNK